ncbi:RB1-inducible coiled-coil protein 1-like [Tropilaelaps mercedesae]|uniref:RB1-inducible coiled-coil protein 1 n=1 Tax=Tropilaelaps mercedesae TaxID=418985 RepID=A0A1V9XML0_9ACAR|nr:RB1-inducible coiled-coil protein 1-like [Tropilaelaps mercedesae]
MLFIFSVEKGTMLTFEMDFAYQSVDNLKGAIAQTQSIPIEKQVLLISGGECLSNTRAVASYGAGTDTNPIFLFNKALYIDVQSPNSPEAGRHQFSNPHAERQENLILQRLNAYCDIGDASMTTIKMRTQLAQELMELSAQEAKLCRQKVHEQHLQQQAWSAVIANLEDAIAAFQKRAAKFVDMFEAFTQRQSEFQIVLDNFPEDNKILARVPLLPGLTLSSQQNSSGSTEASSAEEGPATLLEYVLRSNPSSSLVALADSCRKGLAQMNGELLEEIRKKVNELVDKTSQRTFKYIGGLEDRLSGLEELMRKADGLVAEQEPICQHFLIMQAKASKLKDSDRQSVIANICQAQPDELRRMHQEYIHLKDITRRCSVAKEELCKNLRYRLHYITHVEGNISEQSTNLAVYEKRIASLIKGLSKMEQIHIAPQIYVKSVAEVIRRKRFSTQFLKWAGSLSTHCKEVYRSELAKRRAYREQTRSHFVRALFSGLDDVPPPYATTTPTAFDDRLPPVELADVERLRQAMPANLAGLLEMSISLPSLSLMDVDNASHSASDISSKKTVESDAASHQEVRAFEMPTTTSLADPGYVTDNSNNVVMELSVEKAAAAPDSDVGTREQKICTDVLHCEDVRTKLCVLVSELRTMVGGFAEDTTALAHELTRWTGELQSDASEVAAVMAEIVQRAQSKEKSLEERLEIEQHKLKDAQAEIDIYYDQLRQMKEFVDHSKNEMKLMQDDYESRLTKLQLEHELEMESVGTRHAQRVLELDVRVEELQEKNRKLQVAHDEQAAQLWKATADCDDRLARLREEFAERELSMRENLERQHKNELESLRCRYKLTASVMSTSSGTLGSDAGSSYSPPLGGPGEVASPPGSSASPSSEIENRWRLREMELQEKIRQLERTLQERSNDPPAASACAAASAGPSGATDMDTSCTSAFTSSQFMADSQYRVMAESTSGAVLGSSSSGPLVESTVVRLATSSPSGGTASAIELIEQLRGKEAELLRIQMRIVATCGTGSLPSLSSDRLSILSCVHGDLVLVAYDENRESYMIFMLSSLPYFLHKDSLGELGLSTDPEQWPKRWIIGEVVDKEHCEARRAVNRYKLAVGTRFYRVRVRPWDRKGAVRREQERRQMLKAMTAAAQGGAAAGSAPAGSAPAGGGGAATRTGANAPEVVSNAPSGAASPVASPATSI